MDDRTKSEIFTKLLNSLNKNVGLKEEINRTAYNNQIKLIRIDLVSKVNSDQETALQMLKMLIENNVQDIQQDVITILCDDSVDQELKISILDSIKNYIKDLLQSNNVTDLASLYATWKIFDEQRFYELLGSASVQETQDDDSQSEPISFSNLIMDHFLPVMLSSNQINLNQPLMEVATKIAKMFPISNLSAKEYQSVLKKVPDLLTQLANLQKSNSDVWQKPLHFLTEYLDEKIYCPEIREMFGSSSINWDLVQIELDNNINIELIKYISENNLVLVTRLFRGWENLDPQKFRTALHEMCQSNEYIPYCKTFFLGKLVPLIMAPKDMCDPMKVYYIEIAMEFASSLPLTKLSPEEYNKFLGCVNDYIKNISDLRDMNFEYWHKLWIFLVRLFGKKLHHSMSLINRLLRVVEHAFRNSSYEQRLRGYDCWKELIDNCSMDSNHISSEKQIRLLLTPLRAKFSKQEAVIVKRFEVFVYLIEKLQDKAVLVLKEFLEFCFGEVGEDTVPNKSGQGKSLPELWHRSAKVLLAMLGHSHDSSEPCLETNTEISLMGPVLNSNNISNHYFHTINSVGECCILLKEVELNERKNIVIECFWNSLLSIIIDSNVVKNDKCKETVGKVLEKLLKDEDPYYSSIAAEILKSTIKCNWSKVFPLVLNNLEYFNRILFSVPLNKESYLDIEKFQIMLCTVESAEVTLQIIHNLYQCFAEYQTIESNANFVAQFWIFLVNELDDYAKDKCLNFLIWPALHLHHVTNSAKEVLIHEHYKQIVTKFVEKSGELQLGLFKNFEKILKNDPLLVKNVITLVTMFTPKTENKELTNITLDILDLMMVIPTIDNSSNQRQNLELYLNKFYESNITSIHDHDTIKKLCTCLQHILKFKHYDVLDIVETNLKSLPDNLKWVYGKFLSLDFLMDLFEKETDVSTAAKIRKLIDIFRNVKNPEAKKDIKPFIPLGGRSAKIAKLVKQMSPSPGNRSDSPTSLRLFGKDIDTHSPLNVKGSQLKDLKDTPTKTKTSTPKGKHKKAVCIDDESNSKFVLIETEVKLDKSKLTEHQKEALKKRREDIPALYQDLSQSNTQSLESNSVSSKMEGTMGAFKIIDKNCDKKTLIKEYEKKEVTDVSDAKVESAIKLLNNIEEAVLEIKENNTIHVNDLSTLDKLKADSLTREFQNNELSKTELKKTAVEAELKKLSMSIVGAEDFLAASSKRKTRKNKLDLKESKEESSNESKNKGLLITPKANKSSLPTTEQETEEENETQIKEKNDLDKPDVQVKKRRRKSTSNKRADSPTEEPKQDVSANQSKPYIAVTNTSIAEKSSESAADNKTLIEVDDSKAKPLKGCIKLAVKADFSLEESVNKTVKLGNDDSEDETNTKKIEVINRKERKNPSAKKDPAEASFKSEEANQTELKKDVREKHFTKEQTHEAEELGIDAEIIKASSVVECDKEPSIVNTLKVVKKRGWPLGVKRNLSNQRAAGSPKGRSPARNNHPQTDIKILSDNDDNLSTPNCDTVENSESGSDKKQKRRGRGRIKGRKNSLSKEDDSCKMLKEVVKAEPTKIDVYRFDTEHEKASENEIILLRSPNKDKKLTLATNDIPNNVEKIPTEDLRKKVTKNLVISDISELEETPSVGRKSKRKSIPTEKFTQSELFKSSEPTTQTPGSLKYKRPMTPTTKVLHSNKKGPKKDNSADENLTQSELFKQTVEENEVEPLTKSNASSKLIDKDQVSKKVEKDSALLSDTNKQIDSDTFKSKVNLKTDTVPVIETSEPDAYIRNIELKGNNLRKGIKRRRSSSEDDDIIESSQDSATSNVSAAKLKLPLTKRSSFEKSVATEFKYNVEDIKKTEEIINQEPLEQVNTSKGKMEVSPEETKRKRGRRKFSVKTNSPDSDVPGSPQLHSEVQTYESNEIKNPNKTVELKTTPEIKKRRGRPFKQHDHIESNEIKNPDKTVEVITTPEIKKRRGRPFKQHDNIIKDSSDKSIKTPSDNDIIKIEVSPKGGEETQSNSDITKIDISPKGKRGRPRRSPAKSDDLFKNPDECQNSDNEGIDESQSLVSIGGNKFGSNEETIVDLRNSEESKPKHRRHKAKEDSKTAQSPESSKNDKLESIDESMSRRNRNNTEEVELSQEVIDGSMSDQSTLHMLEAIERVASGINTFNDKPKRGKKKSPVKTEKEAEELTQDIMQHVKKQILTESFKEPPDSDISIQNPQQRTQSQDTQTQDADSVEITDEIQLQLDFPQKPVLDETDKELARMDTASLSLGNLEELNSFDVSSCEETGVENNKTVIENRTLTKCISESESFINFSEETKNRKSYNITVDKISTNKDTEVSKDKTLTIKIPKTMNILNSSEKTKPLTESSKIAEIPETEDVQMNIQDLDNMDVQQFVEIESRPPNKEETPSDFTGTPGPLQSSLPSSPVTGDTPNRTSELLNCTSDISPIGSKSSSDEELVEQRKLVPVALKFDDDADHEANKEKSPEKADDAPEKINEMSPEKAEKDVDKATSSSPPKDEAKTSRDVKNIAERSSKFFEMVRSGSPTTLRLFSKRKAGLNMSPSASRIKKLMSNVKTASESEVSDIVSQEDILTFTRDVPSPLAVPRSSILKRKHSDIADDGLSPCPKRKRVNFSDPCTTSKKVFIKEDGSSQCLFGANSEEDLDKQFLEVLAANTPQTESDIETEQSLQVGNPLLLRDDMPIYPDLVDCEENISVISRKLTSPMFVNALLNKLNGRNIKTIGDLASQSEVSIARLPFKTPMVANVYKALDNYYHKNFKSKVNKEKYEPRINGEPEAAKKETSPLSRLEVALVKMDVKDELLKVLERARSQSMSADTICSLLFSALDQRDILTYVKTHLKLETKDIVDKKDYSKLVKHITQTVGLPKIFEILTDSLESPEKESVYLDCMIKHLIKKKTLSSLIKKISLQELQAALWENVESKVYTKKEFFDTCFFPFVNSIDLAPLFNKMTVVQIEDIIVTRLKEEDYPVFIKKILKKHDCNEVKEEILNQCSISELTSNIIKKGSPQEIISSFTYMFLSAEKGKDDLVQIFRLVSDSLVNVLPPTKLMELSIEFQKKIPIKD